MLGLSFSHPIMTACDLNYEIVQKLSWTMRGLRDRSMQLSWIAQHPSVHGGLRQALGLGTRTHTRSARMHARAGPTYMLGRAFLCVRMSPLGPAALPSASTSPPPRASCHLLQASFAHIFAFWSPFGLLLSLLDSVHHPESRCGLNVD